MDIDPEGAAGLEPPPQDKMEVLKRKTDEVLDTMKDNTKILVDRVEKLEELDEISKQLEREAVDFKRTAQQVKCSYCLKNVKLVVVIVVVVLVILLIIILLATGVIPVGSSSTIPPIPPIPPIPIVPP